jgi:hypothetical protein
MNIFSDIKERLSAEKNQKETESKEIKEEITTY